MASRAVETAPAEAGVGRRATASRAAAAAAAAAAAVRLRCCCCCLRRLRAVLGGRVVLHVLPLLLLLL
jgi:hypothetical protein